MADLDTPIAVRRSRRSTTVPAELKEADPQTPRAAKRVVRFSDPGPSRAASYEHCGLTPHIRRTCIGTPRRRRSSATSLSCRAGTFKSAQTCEERSSADGSDLAAGRRGERRVRRSNMRDLLNKLEHQERQSRRLAQAEIGQLKAEVRSKDREIYELQNATIVMDTERIWDLEHQVADLRDELDRRCAATPRSESTSPDWTFAAKDPFGDDVSNMAPEDDHFGDATVMQLVASTPSRARSSFPTPPATSPLLPATPSIRDFSQGPTVDAGVQASMTDLASRNLKEEVKSLQNEVAKLTDTLDSYQTLSGRIADRLSTFEQECTGAPLPERTLEAVAAQVEHLLSTMSERNASLQLLSSSIQSLGFPGSEVSEMITSLTSGLRTARLELEYLTPGEIALPLTSRGAEVLDLLLSRLRAMARKAQDDESLIDEYHEIEQSLRKQLDARVAVMNGLKTELSKADGMMRQRESKIRELQIGNDRLLGAIDGYTRDISELEQLVERLEGEACEAGEAALIHQSEKLSNSEALAAKDASIAELERRIEDALQHTSALQQEISHVQDRSTKHIVSLNKQHGTALALRDARVLELRAEIARVNESLRTAHETVHSLRVQNGALRGDLDDEKQRTATAMDTMKAELQRALQISQEILQRPGKRARSVEEGPCEQPQPDDGIAGAVTKLGKLVSSSLARRSSKRMRRRYDSGTGFLEEDEVEAS